MNRWKRAAILCAIIAAMGTSSPVLAGLDRNTVTAETAAIKVNKHFPADMAAEISPDTPLTVEFAGAINPSFYQTVSLNLFNGTEPVEGELFYNPSARQIMFKSKQNLAEGQTYTAQLSYYDGLGRTSEKVWSFQTTGSNGFRPVPSSGNAIDQAATPPDPADFLNIANANMGSGQIDNNTPLEVTFSEPLDIVSLKSAPVKLFENNQPVGIDYKLSRDLKTLTISARNPLKHGAAYAIAIDKNLASTSGYHLHKKTLIPFKLAGNQAQVMVPNHEIEETPAPAAPRARQQRTYDNPFASEDKSMTVSQATQPAPVQQIQPVKAAPPVQLVGLSPVNGDRVTNLTQPVTIGFSDEIRPETLNEFTFRLEDDFGPVPARIHYFKGHKQATLTPVGLLDSNKTYRVVVTQGVTDLAGRPIRSGINSMFSTTSPVSSPAMPEMMASQPQTQQTPQRDVAELESFSNTAPVQARVTPKRQMVTRPQTRRIATVAATAPADRKVRTMVQDKPSALNPFKVTAIYPGADNQNVSRKSKIAVHFSEQADPSTVNNINISVFGKQTRVEGKVIYDRRKNRAIFEPERPLDANTKYKVIVNDKIKSRMGETLASNFSWEFATAENIRHLYAPKKTAEADAAFFIPLVDSKLKKEPGHAAAKLKNNTRANTGSAFNFVDPKHWSFKSVRHISNKGILNTFPFVYTDSVTRYEFATAINSALSNLKAMQYMQSRPRLKVADMVELQQLIVEFRSELKSCAVNTTWFENFLRKQGVNLQQVEQRVRKLNQG